MMTGTVRGRGWLEVTEWTESALRRAGWDCGLMPLRAAERLRAVPDDDPWYDETCPGFSLPDVDDSAWGRHRR